MIAQLDIEPTLWKWGADNTAIMGLTLTDDGFAFTQEPMTTTAPILHCVFALPGEPVIGPVVGQATIRHQRQRRTQRAQRRGRSLSPIHDAAQAGP